MGIRFDECRDFLFNVSFTDSMLDYTWFINKKLHKTKFSGCSIRDANFSGADLTKAVFVNCDLSGSVFDRTNLQQSDFTSAYNYTMDPEINMLKGAKFSSEGLAGLLHKYNIKIS